MTPRGDRESWLSKHREILGNKSLETGKKISFLNVRNVENLLKVINFVD